MEKFFETSPNCLHTMYAKSDSDTANKHNLRYFCLLMNMYGITEPEELAKLYKSYCENDKNAYYLNLEHDALKTEIEKLLSNPKVTSSFTSCNKAFNTYNGEYSSTFFENYVCSTCKLSPRYLNARIDLENKVLCEIYNNSTAQVPKIDVVIEGRYKRDKSLANIFKSYIKTSDYPCIYRPLNRYLYEFYYEADPLVFETFTYPSITREDLVDMFEEHMRSWLANRIIKGYKDEAKIRENSLKEFEYDAIIDHLMYLRSLEPCEIIDIISKLNEPYVYTAPESSKCFDTSIKKEAKQTNKKEPKPTATKETSADSREKVIDLFALEDAKADETASEATIDINVSSDEIVTETNDAKEPTVLDIPKDLEQVVTPESDVSAVEEEPLQIIANVPIEPLNTSTEPVSNETEEQVEEIKEASPAVSDPNGEEEVKTEADEADDELWIVASPTADDEVTKDNDDSLDDDIFIIDTTNLTENKSESNDEIFWIDTTTAANTDDEEDDELIIDIGKQDEEKPKEAMPEKKAKRVSKIERDFENLTYSLLEFYGSSLETGDYIKRITVVDSLNEVPKLLNAITGIRPVAIEYLFERDSFLVFSYTTKQSFLVPLKLGKDCLWELFSSERLKLCLNKLQLCYALYKEKIPTVNVVSLSCIYNTLEGDLKNISDIFTGMYFVSDNMRESYMNCYEKTYYTLMDRLKASNKLKEYKFNDAFIEGLAYSYDLSYIGFDCKIKLNSLSDISYLYNIQENNNASYAIYEVTIPPAFLNTKLTGNVLFMNVINQFTFNSAFTKYGIRVLKVCDNQINILCNKDEQGVTFDIISDSVRSSYKKLAGNSNIDFSIQLMNE